MASIGEHRLEALKITAAALPALAGAATGRVDLAVVAAGAASAASLLALISEGIQTLIVLLTWALLASLGGGTWAALAALSALLAALSYAPQRLQGPHRSGLPRLLAIPLFYAPTYLLDPASLLPALTYTLGVAALYLRGAILLSKAEVGILPHEAEAPLGGEVRVPLLIRPPEGATVHYSVVLDGRTYSTGSTLGELVEEIRVKAGTLGLQRHSVEVVLLDDRGLASLRRGPYSVDVRVYPRFRSIVRLVEEALQKREIDHGLPEVYEVRARIPRGPARGGPAPGPREAGEGPAGEREGGGAGGPAARAPAAVLVDLLGARGSMARSRPPGEYSGAREYVPGDNPREIHWKKSVAKQELVVKVYTPTAGRGGGGSLLVIADWNAQNPEEFDSLVERTYAAVAAGGRGERILLLTLPGGRMYVVKGDPVQVLVALNEIVRREGVSPRYSYGGWSRARAEALAAELERHEGFFSDLSRYYQGLAASLASLLASVGLRPGAGFTMIHSSATAVRYGYLARALRSGRLVGPAVSPEEVGDVRVVLMKALRPRPP